MTNTKKELPLANAEKPVYYVDMGNNTWIDNMGQKYTLSELATAIKKREQEEKKQQKAGIKTVLAEQGNQPVVHTPLPDIKPMEPGDVLKIWPSINHFRSTYERRGQGLDSLDRLRQSDRGHGLDSLEKIVKMGLSR